MRSSALFNTLILSVFLLLSTYTHSRDIDSPREYMEKADKIRLSDIDRAYDLLNKAFELAQKSGDKDLELEIYIKQAKLAKSQKEFYLAQQYLHRGEQIFPQATDDKSKVEVLYLSAEILRLIKRYDSALEYSRKALVLAKIINDPQVLYKTITIQGNVYRSDKRYNAALASYLSGQDYVEKTSNKNKVKLYGYIATTYMKLKQYQLASRFHQKAILILDKTNDVKNLPKTLLELAQTQKENSEYGGALISAKRALSISKESNNEYYLLKSLLNLSVLYRRLGSYELALDHGLEALSIFERNEDYNGIASAANSIGLLYVHLEQFDNAENYFNQVLSIQKDLVLVKYRGAALRELSLILMLKGEHGRALRLSEDAYGAYEEIHDANGMASVNKISGQIYQKMGNVDKAEKAYLSGVLMSKERKDKWGVAINLSHLADLLITVSPKKSKEYALESLRIAQEIKAKFIIEKAYASLIQLEKKSNNFEQALEYAELKEQLIDEVKTKAINKRIAELHIVLDIEKKERELINYKRQQTILSLELDRKKNELDIISKDDAINALRNKNTNVTIFMVIIIVLLTLILLIKLRRKASS